MAEAAEAAEARAEVAEASPRGRRRASIRVRITAAALAVVTIAFGVGAVAMVWTLERTLQASVAEQLSDEQREAVDDLARVMNGNPRERMLREAAASTGAGT